MLSGCAEERKETTSVNHDLESDINRQVCLLWWQDCPMWLVCLVLSKQGLYSYLVLVNRRLKAQLPFISVSPQIFSAKPLAFHCSEKLCLLSLWSHSTVMNCSLHLRFESHETMVETHSGTVLQRHTHLHTTEDITVSSVITAVTGHCCVKGEVGHYTPEMSSDAHSTFVATN